MASDPVAAPASERPAMNLDQAADAISGLMNREPPNANSAVLSDAELAGTAENTDVIVDDDGTEQAVAQEGTPEEQEAELQDSVSQGKDAAQETDDGEAQDTEDVELDPAQLAALHGLEEDDLSIDEEGAIRIKTKVDGKIAEVPISELKDSYQLAKTSQQRLQKLAEERKTFETERGQVSESLSQQHQMMTTALNEIEQQYAHDWQQVDWKRIREDDPEQYTLKRQDYDDRMRQIATFKQNVQAQQQQVMLEKQQRQQMQWQQGAQLLNEKFSSSEYKSAPAWDDAEKNKLVSWMTEQGFSQQEIGEISSPYVFKWARDSMLRKQESVAAKKAVKKVLKLPKVKAAKPGAKTNERAVAKKTAVQNAKARQRKSGGDLNSTANLIKQIFDS